MSQYVELICGNCGFSFGQVVLHDQAVQPWREVRCVDCWNNADGVPLMLKKGATGGAVIEKKVALAKTVREFLGFDAQRLFARIKSAANLDEYTVALERTDTLLSHHETLERQGVQANDTLTITEP